MSAPGHYESENRALALGAFSLVKALLNALEKKGVLEDAEVQAVLDETLITLEHRPQDEATDLGRRIIEALVMTRRSGPEAPE